MSSQEGTQRSQKKDSRKKAQKAQKDSVFNDFLPKPVMEEELFEILRRYLRVKWSTPNGANLPSALYNFAGSIALSQQHRSQDASFFRLRWWTELPTQ
jgi:hypothetical protein